MSSSWVVKLKLADPEGAVLINVTTKDRNKDLDLDLLATDGDAAFRGKVRTRSLDKLRAKNYDGSAKEWSSILKYALISKQSSQLEVAVKDSLEIQCSISGKDPKLTLSITFRTLVQDISQHLGTIEVPQTEDTSDVDLFSWASQLADRRDELESEAAEQRKTATVEADNINTVQRQLDDLTKAKDDHERELMNKFVLLLNEKKHELRRLQRVLETARVDPKQLKALQEAEKASGKRGQKRSARSKDEASEEDESDAFDDMDVDDKANEQESEKDQATDESSTESENEVDLDHPVTSQTVSGPSVASNTRSQVNAPSEMPAPRELPFTKRSQKEHPATSQTSSTPAQNASKEDDDATESEDDEL